MRIGLFGGSFDPAHAGHVHVAETAQKRFGLDKVWWLVAPQNPLKAQSGAYEQRYASARRLARGAKHEVTDIERTLDCRYTYQTLRALKRLYPGVRFSLIVGADTLESLHKWRNWREVAAAVPAIVVARPGVAPRHRFSLPPRWTYVHARLHPHSSTALRAEARQAVAKRAGEC